MCKLSSSCCSSSRREAYYNDTTRCTACLQALEQHCLQSVRMQPEGDKNAYGRCVLSRTGNTQHAMEVQPAGACCMLLAGARRCRPHHTRRARWRGAAAAGSGGGAMGRRGSNESHASPRAEEGGLHLSHLDPIPKLGGPLQPLQPLHSETRKLGSDGRAAAGKVQVSVSR